MANNVGRLGVILGIETAQFITGIGDAAKKLEQFAEKAIQYGKVGATALTAMSVAAIKFADDIQDVAQANDVAIDTVIKLRSALDASGGSADKAGVMLSAFTKFIDTAASGSFEAQKAFKSVGISLKDIATLSQEELLGKALRGLEGIDDQVTRGARAMDLFSKAAKGVAFDNFAQEMQKTSKATQEQITAVQNGAKTWDNFERIVRKVQLAFVEALGPSLEAINTSMMDSAFPKLTMLNKLLNFIASNAFSAGQAIEAMQKTLETVAGRSLISQTYGESDKGFAEMKKLNDEYFKFLENQRFAQEQFDKNLSGVRQGGSGRGIMGYEDYLPKSTLRPTVEGVDTKHEAAMAKLAKETKDRQEYHNRLIEEAKKKNKELYEQEWDALKKKEQLKEDIQKAQDEADMAMKQQQRLRENQLDYDRQILLLNTQNKDLKSYELKYAQDIMSIRAQYLEQEYQIKNDRTQSEEYKNQALAQEIVLRDKAIAQAKEALEISRQESEGSFQKGFGKGFDEFVRNIPNQLDMGRQAFNTLFGSMDAALQNFVRTGKFSFKDFARSLIQDMMLIQARANMMSMMKGVWSMFGGGTPSISLGEAYGGGTAGAVGFSHANGGSPTVGVPNLVGERGPELFIPSQSGMIIPNNNLASVMGGGQTINYNGPYIANMSAIDTQSGAQFLAKNKQAVWATYQSANRSIPVTR